MKKPINPLLAAIVILIAVAVALFVMYKKSNLGPPRLGEEVRQSRGAQYEAQQSMERQESQPAPEAQPAAPEAQPTEDAE